MSSRNPKSTSFLNHHCPTGSPRAFSTYKVSPKSAILAMPDTSPKQRSKDGSKGVPSTLSKPKSVTNGHISLHPSNQNRKSPVLPSSAGPVKILAKRFEQRVSSTSPSTSNSSSHFTSATSGSDGVEHISSIKKQPARYQHKAPSGKIATTLNSQNKLAPSTKSLSRDQDKAVKNSSLGDRQSLDNTSISQSDVDVQPPQEDISPQHSRIDQPELDNWVLNHQNNVIDVGESNEQPVKLDTGLINALNHLEKLVQKMDDVSKDASELLDQEKLVSEAASSLPRKNLIRHQRQHKRPSPTNFFQPPLGGEAATYYNDLDLKQNTCQKNKDCWLVDNPVPKRRARSLKHQAHEDESEDDPPQQHNVHPTRLRGFSITQLPSESFQDSNLEGLPQLPPMSAKGAKLHTSKPTSEPTVPVMAMNSTIASKEHSRFHHRRQPIARKWSTIRKRFTALISCITTFAIGLHIGMYSGMIPQIQYQLADTDHYVIQGNIYLYIGMASTSFLFWPLPLFHGRKPYILMALCLVLPLQFPQAIMVTGFRSPTNLTFRSILLVCRFLTGLLLGFANINQFPILLDLFGASLQSEFPHEEIVIPEDPRRDGGGIGLWLGLWTWCWSGSLAIGFSCGASIIYSLTPQWGFYTVTIILAFVVALNILAPETRRSTYRTSWRHLLDDQGDVKKLTGRGEVKLHISIYPPTGWWEEVLSGIKLNFMMLSQWGFLVMAVYLGWTYSLIVLVITLLGNLLSIGYRYKAKDVALGVFAIAIGALLAIPLSTANILSRTRRKGPRTDSMTLESEVSWSSHLVRRFVFMIMLPLVGIAYAFSSYGPQHINAAMPISFATFIGFLSNLAITECFGLIMETFDTSDLQPGVNTKHRTASMATIVRLRRTNYSSFPRVASGIFASQSIRYLFAAAATGVGGVMTRRLGAQVSAGVTAGILLGLTTLLSLVLWRFHKTQVIPQPMFGGSYAIGRKKDLVVPRTQTETEWKAVIVGNPSGIMRRINVLEMGHLSRWTDIRILNRLLENPRKW